MLFYIPTIYLYNAMYCFHLGTISALIEALPILIYIYIY